MGKMTDMWDFLRGMFKDQEKLPAGQPYMHHMMETGEEETRQFESWKDSSSRQSMIKWIQMQILAWKSGQMQLDEAIDFLDTPSAKGFVIYLDLIDFTFLEMKHLMDHLRDNVLDLNYRKYMSDVRSFQRAQWHETIYRHYLKPPFRMDADGRFEQLYGNIHIEFQLRDDEPRQFKFSTITKRDRLYHPANDFETLLDKVIV